MRAVEREPGFYWVRSVFDNDTWVVAEWICDRWFHIALEVEFLDHELKEIDERRIERAAL